jgi:hypothetical protein
MSKNSITNIVINKPIFIINIPYIINKQYVINKSAVDKVHLYYKY